MYQLNYNKSIRNILILVFLFFYMIRNGTTAGSYRQDGLPQPSPKSPKYIENITSPIPSNDWWSSVLTQKLSYLMMAFPLGYTIKTLNGNQWGLGIQYKGAGFLVANDVVTSDDPDIWLKSTNIVYANLTAKVYDYGDWNVNISLSDNSVQKIKVILVKGSPFIYTYISDASSPEMYFNFAVNKFFDDFNNTILSVDGAKYTNDHIGIEFSGSSHIYGIFCPTNTVFTRVNGNYLQIKLGNNKNFMSIAVLTTNSDLNYYYQHAYAFITNTIVSWNYDAFTGIVTSTFNAEISLKRGGFSSEPILGLFPHQWKYSTAVVNPQYYTTQRGKIYTYTGTSFNVENKFYGIIPTFTKPEWDNTFSVETQKNYLSIYSNVVVFEQDDTYWQGKRLSSVARAALIADQIGDTNKRDYFLNGLKTALEDWYTYTVGEPRHYFSYYNDNAGATNDWGVMVGYDTSYNSQNLTDLHFHYGYFIYASAILSLYDEQFKTDYGGMVEHLIRTINSPYRNDSMYPFLRYFDPYEGHCWADGTGETGDGNNQESSSESMNAWIGIFLWGLINNNTTYRDLGIWGYTVESTAIMQYYYNVDGDNWLPTWAQKSVGILFGGKYTHSTWFSAEPECIFGIQWIPLTPSHMYLGYNQTLAQNLYNAMVSENGGNENEDTWYDVIWKFQSLFAPQSAISKFNSMSKTSPNDDPNMQDGSWADCYWFIHSMASLGSPVTNIYAYNWPSYQVFNKSGTNVYVAFNPEPVTNEVVFKDSSGYLGKLVVPPYSTRASRNLDSFNIALDHFEIIHDGEGITNSKELISIRAIDNMNNIMTNWTGTVTLYVAPGSVGNIIWYTNSFGNNGSFIYLGNNKAVYSFVPTDKGIVTLQISDDTVESIDPEVTDMSNRYDNDISPQWLKFLQYNNSKNIVIDYIRVTDGIHNIVVNDSSIGKVAKNGVIKIFFKISGEILDDNGIYIVYDINIPPTEYSDKLKAEYISDNMWSVDIPVNLILQINDIFYFKFIVNDSIVTNNEGEYGSWKFKIGSIIEQKNVTILNNVLNRVDDIDKDIIIMYNLETGKQVNVCIYDINGDLVKLLEDEYKNSGRYIITWDKINSEGKEIPPGIYFVVIKLGTQVNVRKVMIW